jgi:hypothetical protein
MVVSLSVTVKIEETKRHSRVANHDEVRRKVENQLLLQCSAHTHQVKAEFFLQRQQQRRRKEFCFPSFFSPNRNITLNIHGTF